MSNYYRRLLRNIFILLLMIFGIISVVVYDAFEDYLVVENKSKVKDLLMHDKALHSYVEYTLKPVIYKLQAEGKLSYDYFDPKLLSFTYISRHLMEEYNKQRDKEHLEKYIYKIASNNPRNPVNKATPQEKKLLKRFNNGEFKLFTKEIFKNGKNYIYYAMPVKKNNGTCMRCHSRPEVAPKGLIKLYGSKAGFSEDTNKSRAFFSLTIPLKEDTKNMEKLYMYFFVALSIIFIVSLVIIYFFIKILDEKDKKLLDKVKHDGLTSIYNRYKFNHDMEEFVKSKRDESIYLMMFDIDHFKNINDKYGHPVGDIVLKELCDTVSKSIRPTDMFYRVGGEEFAIFSFSNTYEKELEFANRLNNIVKKHSFEVVRNISISIGFTKFIKGERAITLYERCDKALYKAKENGRDRVEFL